MMIEAGMRSFDHRLPGMARESKALVMVARLDPAIHGTLVQLPLPLQINPH
jgi:methylenetetrahydrofolate dehydrogenase (NADP+) / methenyltetrahydrofolate cyclohydrolase